MTKKNVRSICRRWSNIFLVIFISLICSAGQAAAGTYVDSAHGDSTAGVTGRRIGYAIGNCAHCHDQHAAVVDTTHDPYEALRGLEEEGLCEDCHDGSPTTDIQTEINKAYGHTYLDDPAYSGRHNISATIEYNGTGSAVFGSANRHVECSDCHEPHSIGDYGLTHTVGGTGTGANGNAITQNGTSDRSDPLQGVWGVEYTGEVTWGTASGGTITKQNPATKEYQICFKCHSYFALNDSDGITATTGPSGQTITDQGMEFSDTLRSFHPVRQGLTAGTYTDALDASQTNATWDNEGIQTMYCSDCHGNNAAPPVGPHGSARLYMLTGTRQYWPASSTGDLWSLNDIRNLDSSDSQDYNGNAVARSELFCLNCHDGFGNPASTNSGDWVNDGHKDHDDRSYEPAGGGVRHNVYCIACHAAVPHGMRRSALIVYDGRVTTFGSDDEPYRYVAGGTNYAALSGFDKAATPGGYSKDNCYSTVTRCTTHGDQDGSGGIIYERNAVP